MGKKDELLQIFNVNTSGNNYLDGVRIVENDLVTDVEVTVEDNIICIHSGVISENLFSEYSAKIEIDCGRRTIISTYCTCDDYEKFSGKKDNYACKHLVGMYYKSLIKLEKLNFLKDIEKKTEDIASVDGMLMMLLGEKRFKDEVNFEVYLNRDPWDQSVNAEFKLVTKVNGRKKSFIIRDMDQFMTCYHNKAPVSYGNDFVFSYKTHKLSNRDMKLISFIETLMEMDRERRRHRGKKEYYEGKYLIIPQYMLRQFLHTVIEHRVFLKDGFFSRVVETEILFGRPPFDLHMDLDQGAYYLRSSEGMPAMLGDKKDVFLYGTTIYLPDFDFSCEVAPYLEAFSQAEEIRMSGDNEEEILRELVPKIYKITRNVRLDEKIKRKIVNEKCIINFYFDGEGKDISLEVKVRYGEYEFNIFETFKDKVVYRDSEKEAEAIKILDSLKFEERDNKFYFKREDMVFKFFKYEIIRLQRVGDVFYSERFKGIKNISSKGIQANVQAGKYDYFEMKFSIEKVPSVEMKGILRSFRENMKYHKLKDGEFLDLENLELQKLFKLIDAVSPEGINEDRTIVSKNKAAYIYDYTREKDIEYVEGDELLKDIRDKIVEIKGEEFEEPNGLNGTLRDYQRTGYNWMKTIQNMSFGGILGDEMGLGKTLQAITYILSNKGEKTIVVVPTTLLYNWIDEAEKFAPSLKIGNVTGVKTKREKVIENYEKYDVLITTYNTLRRDISSYEEIYFNTIIIDEAQYIKNPHAQVSKAIKKLKGEIRFALTGTPLENSLMELWSIFDYIMPGYLYDEKRFSVRYHKKLHESPEVLQEVNRLIKPFILRRTKQDVLKELPDKIESLLKIEMDKEQKKVYSTYAKYAVELIEKRVKDREFRNSKIEILAYITKLRQLCLHPSVVMDNYDGGSGKIEALMELLHRSIDEGHKVLVFSQFTSVLKMINHRMEHEKISFSYLDGTMSSSRRMRIVKDFNEGDNSVFTISLKAGGTGLNLTSADVVVHFDPWWNPAVEDQATDRAHRIGQHNVVEVIKIIARGTIEEKIVQLQNEKKMLIEKVMDDGISTDNMIKSLSDDDIFELFDIKRAID